MVVVQLPNQVYRLDPKTREVHVVADGFEIPNGITFSPDGNIAYVYVFILCDAIHYHQLKYL